MAYSIDFFTDTNTAFLIYFKSLDRSWYNEWRNGVNIMNL